MPNVIIVDVVTTREVEKWYLEELKMLSPVYCSEAILPCDQTDQPLSQ